jgi:hypothetical protein
MSTLCSVCTWSPNRLWRSNPIFYLCPIPSSHEEIIKIFGGKGDFKALLTVLNILGTWFFIAVQSSCKNSFHPLSFGRMVCIENTFFLLAGAGSFDEKSLKILRKLSFQPF